MLQEWWDKLNERFGGRVVSIAAAVVTLALVAGVCVVTRPASDQAQEVTDASGDVTGGASGGSGDGGGSSDGDGSGSGGTSSGTTGSGGSTATVAAPGEPVKVTKTKDGVPVANLFTAEENRVGISGDELLICMHAAFALGDVFNNEAEDEDVYWRMINAQGGIDGMKVRVSFQDDAYAPDLAVQAAENCRQQEAFFILSGVGFDQIPAVRNWAEENRQLYLHSMVTEEGSEGKRFSFATAPTLETLGRQIGEYFLSKYPNKTYAAISRNSTNWDPALKAFKAALAKKGKKLAYEAKTNNGDDYNVHIQALQTACPAGSCALFANENVLNFVKMFQQATLQTYVPQWFNYGFQLTNDTIGAPAATAKIAAWYPTPAYDRDNETNQPWWDEIKRMKDAYAKYCTGDCDKDPEELNDVDWQFWLAWKALHRFIVDCGGKDCTRNRMVGLLLDGYKTKVDPLCAADFSKGNGHFGAHQANIFEAVPHSSSGAVWKQVRTCKTSF